MKPPDDPTGALFGQLQVVLRRGGLMSVCHKPVTQPRPFIGQVLAAADASALVDRVKPHADVWFGLNDLTRVTDGRGRVDDVRRLVGLAADLDIKEGAFSRWDELEAVIGDLTVALGGPPCAVIESGHGLQPIWAVEPADDEANWESAKDPRLQRAAELVKAFGDLVQGVAIAHEGKADPVFDLARLLRVPGTTNFKSLDLPVPTGLRLTPGSPRRSVADLREHIEQSRATAPLRVRAKQQRPPKLNREARPAPPTTAAPAPLNASTYAGYLLRDQARYVRGARTNFDRNVRLNNAALVLGQQPSLSDSVVTDVLLGAAREQGLDPDEALSSIDSGLNAGRSTVAARRPTAMYELVHAEQIWTRDTYRDRVFDSELCIDHKMVLLALLQFMNSDGVCWPNRNTLSAATGLNTKRISTCTRELTQSGWLFTHRAYWVIGPGRKPNAYWLPGVDAELRTPGHCTRRGVRVNNLLPGPPARKTKPTGSAISDDSWIRRLHGARP